MKEIILLGSTGSVGRNVLDIVRRYPDRFRVKAISTKENAAELISQAEEFSPDIAAIADKSFYPALKKKLPAGIKALAGPESIEYLAGVENCDIVFMAISGTAALKPLIAALKAGRQVALASKEPVVSAGKIIRDIIDSNASSSVIPVDSEHSAIMQCLAGRRSGDVRTLYITGTGGSLKDEKKEGFDGLSIERILTHPKWNMGKKITVDSATLMNKGLEVIEARWLFDVPPEKIKVIIHPEAVIHSMVEFLDGTISASLFCPDMRFPILRALSFPRIISSDLPRVDFMKIKGLTFMDPDTEKFPALDLAFRCLKEGGTLPAVLNAANETAVELFLGGRIKFTDIVRAAEKITSKHKKIKDPLLEDIISSERWASEEVLRFCLR
ncbi:MAG: 1-deoxy-D-xylulose-5-phosphate reductoisomerase [Candidatus Omnitrophota bacterium]